MHRRCRRRYQLGPLCQPETGNEIVPKITINNTINYLLLFKTAISISAISSRNSFRVLFDKIASAYFIWKIHLYFSIGNGQRTEPALCQLYRRTFVPVWPRRAAHLHRSAGEGKLLSERMWSRRGGEGKGGNDRKESCDLKKAGQVYSTIHFHSEWLLPVLQQDVINN